MIQAVTFLGSLYDLVKVLSDLQLGDQKVTLNHLAGSVVRHMDLEIGSETRPCLRVIVRELIIDI